MSRLNIFLLIATSALITSVPPTLDGQYPRAAQPPLLKAPTLGEVVAYALQWNPDVVTARLQVDSARGDRRIARSFPNPTVSTIPGNPFQYSLTQPIDIGPDRLFRSRAAGEGLLATRYVLEDVTRQVMFNVRQGYFDLLLAESLRDIAAEERDIFAQLLIADSVRLANGDMPPRDFVTSELNFAHADAALSRANAAARAARLNMQLLMGVRHPDTAFRVAGALGYRRLSIPLDSLSAIAYAARPDIAAAREHLVQSRSLRSLANSLIIPVPGVAAVYQPGTPFASGKDYAFGFSFTVPILYAFGGERQRARAGVASAAVNAERVQSQVQSDVTQAADNFRAAQAFAERYSSGLLSKASAALEMQRFAYRNGAASLLELLNAIRTDADIRTDYYTALHDYWVAAYALDRAAGQDLVP